VGFDSGSGTVAALDLGTTSSRCILFDREVCRAALGGRDHRQICPRRAGWSTTRSRSRPTWTEIVADALADAGVGPVGHRCRRDHQPARDGDRLGPGHGPAGLQRDRVAGHQDAQFCDEGPRRPRRDDQAANRACRSPPTSPVRRSAGSSTTFPVRGRGPRRASSIRHRGYVGHLDLTGGPSGGPSTSPMRPTPAGTLLFDLRALRWDDELLELMGIPRRTPA